MVGTSYAFFLIHSTKILPPIVSSISISTPRRPNPRKNYLRPKLLQTIPQPPPQISYLPPQKHSNNPLETHHFESSENVEIAKVAKFTINSFFQFGICLVGAFVVQTVCAIWVFNSTHNNKGKYQTLENEHETTVDVIVNGKARLRIADDSMQKKIEEIRIMAREARDKERENNGLDGNDSDFEDEEEEGFGKSGIENQVNEKLNKLREKLEKNRDKIPEKFGNLKGDVNPGNESLVFKKRYKYKGPLSDQRDRPKGFSGRSKIDGSKNEVSGSNIGDGSNMLLDDVPNFNEGRNVSKDAERSRQGKNIDVRFSKVQDRNSGGPVAVTADTRDPNFLKADEVTNNQNIVGSSNSLGGQQQLKQSASFTKTHSGREWWEKLPYVLVILMQKSDDDDKVHGLYTLKSSSGEEGELSHIVAFQDRGDATNFCYLLQLYFEDLGDFSIDVVPLSMKELKEAVKSNAKRVIVVKKGQLQLFAGQPISDVEVALRSLMEQD